MTLRITRQMIEVLGAGSGRLRVARQMIEVLIGVSADLVDSASSDLGLTDEAVSSVVRAQSVSSDLGLSTAAEVSGIIIENVGSLLTLTDTADHNFLFVSSSSVLDLSQDLAYAGTVLAEVDTEIEFVDTAVSNIKDESVANLLEFTQDTTVNLNDFISASLETVISLIGSAVRGPSVYNRYLPEGFYLSDGTFIPAFVPISPDSLRSLTSLPVAAGSRSVSVSSVLSLTSIAVGRQAVINKTVSNILSFSESVGKIFENSASSALALDNETERRHYPISVLELVSVAEGFQTKDGTTLLGITDAVSYTAIYARSLESDLEITQSSTYLLTNTGIECTYAPSVGTVSSGITPPPTTAPTLGTATLTLTWPYAVPSQTLVLRNPVFGNIDRLEFQRINRESRGGTLLIYADPNWPKQQVMALQIDSLSEEKKVQLVTFLQSSLGQEIGLLDHENRQWRGIITTPDAEITHVGNCNYSVSFEFEGELV